MKILSVVFLFVCISSFSLANGRLASNSRMIQTQTRLQSPLRRNKSLGAQWNGFTDYDTLVIATEWSGSVCIAKKCNANRPVNKNFFNLHGLWPNVKDDFSKTPFDCKNSRITISSLPQSIQSSLAYNWNQLYGAADGFLNHEWQKHGSCWNPLVDNMSGVPSELKKVVTDSQNCMRNDQLHQQNYILTAIAVAQKYNVFSALAASGILPNSQRRLDKKDVVNAINTYFKISKYQVQCVKGDNGVSYLSEVRICLSKNYIPMDCASLRYDCPAQVIYPAYL